MCGFALLIERRYITMKRIIQKIKDWLFTEEDWVDDIIRNGLHYPRTKQDERIISWLKKHR